MVNKLDFARKLKLRLAHVQKEVLHEKLISEIEENVLLEEILQNINEGILVLDNSGKALFVNNIAELWLGLSKYRHFKGPLFNLIEDEPIKLFLTEIFTENLSRECKDFKILIPREIFLRISVIPLIQSNENQIIIILSDISGVKNETMENARLSKIESLVRLASGIAHEIGNPLNAITIHLELIKKQVHELSGDKKTYIEESLNEIQGETKRLDRTVKNFLKATRKSPIRLKPENLSDVLKDIISFLKPEMNEKNIKLDLSVSDKQPFLLDRERLYSAFMNLIKNAMDAMPDGGTISISIKQKDNCSAVSISDQGVGILEENLPFIFDAYYTTKPSGSGLGLMSVYDTISEHGGRIEVASKLHKGTTFKVLLPMRMPPRQIPDTRTSSTKKEGVNY